MWVDMCVVGGMGGLICVLWGHGWVYMCVVGTWVWVDGDMGGLICVLWDVGVGLYVC